MTRLDYPETVIEVVDETMRFKASALRAARRSFPAEYASKLEAYKYLCSKGDGIIRMSGGIT